MKIAVAGASGRAGSEITKELSRRGHTVTAIARNPEKIADLPNVTPTKVTCSIRLAWPSFGPGMASPSAPSISWPAIPRS
jgi:uncharacterized protein YbjT (DUF2867 family)